MKRLLKSFKTELRLTESQTDKVRRSLGICRFLANQYIVRNIWLCRLYQRGVLDEKQPHFITANDFDKCVNHVLKKKFPWIDQCGSKARKKVLVNAEQAFRRFFKGQARFPRFKRKNQQNVKLYFPKNNKGDWTIWRHKIQIPTIGRVRLKEFGYLPQGVTIKIENINTSSRARRLEKRLRREQRRLSRKYEIRKKKGGSTATASANIEKKRLSVQKLHQRLTNLRRNYENQVIHALVEQKPRFITVEDLNVTGMMKNRHLSKSVAQQRFYSLREKLRRKAEIIGIEFRIADRFYPSSKTCHACGHVHGGLKLKDRIYVCPVCGYTEDRDLNAALNLRDTKNYRIA
ncbi:RNA-guided endonuclease TnpB family protein [Mitsuokella sp. AF21-1AC]|uniref:RNA-guided endonuclease InsQ/TnpB family protein n=1 Tax=Mitsuokella sp. AF21-1AC TaxID=2292235 RepID=UPI000E4A35D0|nr:RNA-guided endonuclease TnpB family protein [Mitsuokella sp. AF21-1AC]RGS70496.1 transposase [Mitsuokella sp. AF21-1AC]